MKFWSHYFIPTLKESPADAEIPSHKLLIRAGLVRKLGGGLYTYLPLGLRVMQKLTRICQEEMERAKSDMDEHQLICASAVELRPEGMAETVAPVALHY